MVTIDQFARVRAAIDAGGDASDILRDEGLTRAVWRAAERRWIAVLIGETERGEDTHRQIVRDAMHGTSAPESSPPAPPPVTSAAFVPPRPVFQPPSGNVGSTQAAPLQSSEPIPFSGAAAAPRPLANEVAAEAEDMLGRTVTVSALTDEQLADALPFEAADLDSTALITSIDLGDEPSIPFAGCRDAPPAIASLVEEEARDLVGETVSVSAIADTELTLKQYASLVVDLELAASEQRFEVMLRYSIPDDEALSRAQHTWAERFRTEPATYGQFRAAYDAYSAWLKGS